jgi:predicted TIM-barrel enzyme
MPDTLTMCMLNEVHRRLGRNVGCTVLAHEHVEAMDSCAYLANGDFILKALPL